MFFRKKRKLTVAKKTRGNFFSSFFSFFDLSFQLKIFGFFSFGFLIFFLFFSPFFKLSTIKFERTFEIDPSIFDEEVQKLSGKNIFFAPLSSLELELEKKYPRFKEISLKRKLPDAVVLEIQAYENVFILNTYFTKENEKTGYKEKFIQKFLISQSGELKSFLDGFNYNLKEIFVKEDLGRAMETGEIFITEDLIFKIQNLITKLENFYLFKIEKLNYYPSAREFRVKTLENGSFRFTFTKDLNSQLEKILNAKEAGVDLKNSDYLDLRVSEKIIYK